MSDFRISEEAGELSLSHVCYTQLTLLTRDRIRRSSSCIVHLSTIASLFTGIMKLSTMISMA